MAKVSKTELVFNTVSNFHWPFTAAEVAKKLRWKQAQASSVLSYLAKRGDITLQSKESSDRSPIGYVNKYVVTPNDDEYENGLLGYTNDELVAELARRLRASR